MQNEPRVPFVASVQQPPALPVAALHYGAADRSIRTIERIVLIAVLALAAIKLTALLDFIPLKLNSTQFQNPASPFHAAQVRSLIMDCVEFAANVISIITAVVLLSGNEAGRRPLQAGLTLQVVMGGLFALDAIGVWARGAGGKTPITTLVNGLYHPLTDVVAFGLLAVLVGQSVLFSDRADSRPY